MRATAAGAAQELLTAGSAPETDGAKVEVEVPDALEQQSELIPSAKLFGGAEVGTWVHAVYEKLDFQQGQSLKGDPLEILTETLGLQHGVTDGAQYEEVNDLHGARLRHRWVAERLVWTHIHAR